jgi:hypothetical protein
MTVAREQEIRFCSTGDGVRLAYAKRLQPVPLRDADADQSRVRDAALTPGGSPNGPSLEGTPT